MKVTHKPLLFLLASLLVTTTHGRLLPMVDDHGSNTIDLKTYIVHVLRPEGAAELLSVEEREAWHRSFLPNDTLDSGEPRLLFSYHHVISGFAARLTGEEVAAMETIDGFLLANPDRTYSPRTTHSPEFLGLNQYDGLWYDANFGEGTIIGMIDSGITPAHPSFDDDGMPPPPEKWRGKCNFRPPLCNNKLIGARSISVGTSSRDPPFDTNGHGTHCAGVAAGNYVYDAGFLGQAKGTASGVAPRAHLSIYKAKTGAEVLMSLELAIEDGVDVVSISMGTEAIPFHEDEMAIGAFAAATNGLLVSTSAGNSGPYPSSIENDAPWFLTVGMSSTDRRITSTVRLGNGMELDGVSAYQPKNFTSPMMALVNPANLQTVAAIICEKNSLHRLDVKGKIVLCGSGRINNEEKGENVKAAGGAAMIVINQPQEGSTLRELPYTIPAAHVSFDDGWKIIAYFTTTKDPTATIVFKGTQFGAPRSPAVAASSSRGPSLLNGGVLKPDIIGPGVNILGPWHKPLGPNPENTMKNFYIATGTSMAAPHLAGVAALLKKSHPEWSPAAIKSAIMTTAYTLGQDGKPITDQQSDSYKPDLADIFAMGAGHVNPKKADDPGLIYDIQPSEYVAYLCGLGYTDKQVSVIVNNRTSCSRYENISAEDLNYPAITVSLGSKAMKTVKRTVTILGEASSVYSAKVDAPKDVKVVVSPEKLQFSAMNEKKSFTVTISTTGEGPDKNMALEGQLVWVSDKHSVRIPIGVTA